MQPLTPEQEEELLKSKREFAELTPELKAKGACTNLKCRCKQCTCGSACTCNVSPEVTCDPCKDFKAAAMAKMSGARLANAEAFYAEKLAPRMSDDEVPGITTADLKSLLAIEDGAPVLVVDCRSEEERSVSNIPGAISSAAFLLDQSKGKGATVVASCTIGGRSGAFAKQLLQQSAEKPWVELKNLELGILGWCHAGGELVDASGEPTRKVHAHTDSFAGMFPMSGYEVVTEPRPC